MGVAHQKRSAMQWRFSFVGSPSGLWLKLADYLIANAHRLDEVLAVPRPKKIYQREPITF